MYRPDYDFLSPNSMFFLELFESILINNYNYQNPELAINSLNIYKNRFAVDKDCIDDYINGFGELDWRLDTFDQNPNFNIGKADTYKLISDYNQKNILIIDEIIIFFKRVENHQDLYLTDEFYEKINNFKFRIKKIQIQFRSDLEKCKLNLEPVQNEEKVKIKEKKDAAKTTIGCFLTIIFIICFCIIIKITSSITSSITLSIMSQSR